MTQIKISNVHIVNVDHLAKSQDVWIEHGKIQKIAPKIDEKAILEIDGSEKYLMSGLIDLHIHGSANVDAVLLNKQLIVEKTIVIGQIVFERDRGGDSSAK